MSKQAVIYTRYSPRPNAAECDSCEKQLERCRAYCEQRGYHVKAVFSDKAVSGGLLYRPQLSSAIDFLKPDHGEVLVVDNSDRLARDMLVYVTIESQVEQAGATIEFADGSPLGTTPEGKFFRIIMAGQAAYVRDCIRLRTKNGLARKRKNGERTTGKIPIGWQLDPDDPKRLVKHHGDMNAIRRMCMLSTEYRLPSMEIAERLFGLCRGKPWSDRTVRKMIKKHAYWACPVTGDPKLEPKHP